MEGTSSWQTLFRHWFPWYAYSIPFRRSSSCFAFIIQFRGELKMNAKDAAPSFFLPGPFESEALGCIHFSFTLKVDFPFFGPSRFLLSRLVINLSRWSIQKIYRMLNKGERNLSRVMSSLHRWQLALVISEVGHRAAQPHRTRHHLMQFRPRQFSNTAASPGLGDEYRWTPRGLNDNPTSCCILPRGLRRACDVRTKTQQFTSSLK
ncbi:hypothetical protein C8R45DRAFT_1025275 [Mycena sanguinolenta]|nr:hypothetical protein C8R45DRAFT_1046479 [Mycena sanguinolenta]KAJ6463312.1 hypothetical protein C8R45DRAFT_1025275 [Mycena sanguinolenta]